MNFTLDFSNPVLLGVVASVLTSLFSKASFPAQAKVAISFGVAILLAILGQLATNSWTITGLDATHVGSTIAGIFASAQVIYALFKDKITGLEAVGPIADSSKVQVAGVAVVPEAPDQQPPSPLLQSPPQQPYPYHRNEKGE